MTPTSIAPGLNYHLPRASEPVSAEFPDGSQQMASDANSFDMMLVAFAGEIAPHVEKLPENNPDETTSPAEIVESVRTGGIVIQGPIWRENPQNAEPDVCVEDQDAAFKVEEHEADKSNDRGIVVSSDPFSIPAPVTLRVAAGVSVEPNDPEREKVLPPVLNESANPEIIHQDTKRNAEIINFATMETHLPPLINNAAREIEVGTNEIATRDLRESDKSLAHTPIKILKINLHPIELGALAVRIRMSGTTMQIEILAETQTTVSRLSHMREKLLHNLAEAGAEAAKTELTIGFAPGPAPGESPEPGNRPNQDRYGGDERQGGFNNRHPDRRREEVLHDPRRGDDQDTAFGDFFRDRQVI